MTIIINDNHRDGVGMSRSRYASLAARSGRCSTRRHATMCEAKRRGRGQYVISYPSGADADPAATRRHAPVCDGRLTADLIALCETAQPEPQRKAIG